MTDVCLVLMPYAGVQRPSLALGLLKGSLQREGIEATVFYANLLFAEQIGLYAYKLISEEFDDSFAGEWTFSKAAFPDFESDRKAYFKTLPNPHRQSISQLQSVRQQADEFIDRTAKKILDLNPKIVSCSSTFHQHCSSLALLRRIRELAPDVITTMGGSNCEGTMGSATYQAFPWVDFVCSGESDNLFARLCRLLLEKGRSVTAEELPYGVIGAIDRHSDIINSLPAPRSSVPDLDSIPVPNFDDYFDTLKNLNIARYIDPALFVETSRGCWWGEKNHCTFCGLNGEGMTYRSKSPQRAIDELTQLSDRYGVKKIFVVDCILDLRHIKTVMPIFASLDETYNLFYETKANLNRQQVKQLAESGVRWIQPGIEHLIDRSLELMKKGNTALINLQLMKWAREYGVRVLWNFLVGSPGESIEWYDELIEWMPWAIHLNPPQGIRLISYHRFSPYHQHPDRYGLNLVPDRAYSHIYPLSPDLLNDLAYFFEDTHRQVRLGTPPEYQKLEELTNQWRESFKLPQPPMLSLIDQGDRARIVDTRPCAVEAEMVLSGLAYQVYQVCDRHLSQTELVNALKRKYQLEVSWEKVEPVVQELRDRRILLSVSDRYLSLAVREPIRPLMAERDYPSGYVDVEAYVRDRTEKLQNSLKQKLLASVAF